MIIKIPPIELHDGQQEIMSSCARFRVAACGRRFGKTLLAMEWLALSEGGAIDGKPVAIFAPSYKLLLDIWNQIERTLKPAISKANKTEMRIELVTGGVIDFWTLEDQDAGRGRKYARLVIDEAAHARYLEEAWERAIAPTLTDYKGSAWFISTPKGFNYFHTLYQRGLDPEMKEWRSWRLPTSTNPHISAEEINRYKEELPQVVFQQEYLAEFVALGQSVIYPIPESEIICEPFEIPAHYRRCFGMDVGWNRTAAVWLAHDLDSDVVYLYSEYYRGEAEPSVHAEAIRARGRWIPGAIDPASRGRSQVDGAQLFDLYTQLGLQIENADNGVESGIYKCLERLSTGRLKIFSTCVNTLREMRSYARDERGKVIKEDDHAMDAMRYGVVSGLRFAVQKPIKKQTDETYGYRGDLGWM